MPRGNPLFPRHLTARLSDAHIATLNAVATKIELETHEPVSVTEALRYLLDSKVVQNYVKPKK
jgi:hypothetical protein